MNIKICTWYEDNQTNYYENLLEQWDTSRWISSCYDIEGHIAIEHHQDLQLNNKKVLIEKYSSDKTLEIIQDNLYDHWTRTWMPKYKEFLLCANMELIKAKVSDRESAQKKWVGEWLNFHSAYQAMDRFCSSHYGDEERDVVTIVRPGFKLNLDNPNFSLLYQKIHDYENEGDHMTGHFWPPLNGMKELFYAKDSNNQIAAIMGSDHTLRQITNVKNVILYFCEHFQVLNTAMPFDIDPLKCIFRLLDLELIEIEQALKDINKL